MGSKLLVVLMPRLFVGAIIFVSGGPVTAGVGGGYGTQMSSFGMLNFRSVHRNSVVDHWDVLGSMPGTIGCTVTLVS